ncbi:hypothetical protein BHE97_18420 [Aeromicrobium sp. PE09-221]|uniref:TetR/AcrR family transcriptional regulator n=1 Tax=Aeromicrobium sp. PE09-221 TaxID=1898043 RepID=UPI000B3E897F|nr:TetR/AcrR family transcriptional regulator [Aeromicrobium sp. PE09-221]OUZ06762.1 hypothetical protein BHE97_18420 [Aeromicrobium sp. PE09-221]
MLTRDEVVSCAMRVAEGDGLSAVSLRRLGTELGVTAPAIYRHVCDKDDLLDAMAEAVGASIEIPEGVAALEPTATLLLLSLEVRDVVVNSPVAGDLLLRHSGGLGLASDVSRTGRSALERAGLSESEVDRAMRIWMSFLAGALVSAVGGYAGAAHRPRTSSRDDFAGDVAMVVQGLINQSTVEA